MLRLGSPEWKPNARSSRRFRNFTSNWRSFDPVCVAVKTKFSTNLAALEKGFTNSVYSWAIDRHFDIPDNFQEFLRYDSGKDDHERILIFGAPYMTSVLESSKFWLGDGTFKLSNQKLLSNIHPSCICSRHCPCLFICPPSQQNGKTVQPITWYLRSLCPRFYAG